jgi:hypothetical protein
MTGGQQPLVVTGAIELQLDTLAERVARRVVELLETGDGREMDPGAGARVGARWGGVTDTAVDYEPSSEVSR